MSEDFERCDDEHPDGGIFCRRPAGHDGEHGVANPSGPEAYEWGQANDREEES